jgi:hypothetical protein
MTPGFRGAGLMDSEKKNHDQDWENAQAALATAQAMPGGPARIEALKIAGKLRFQAAAKFVSPVAKKQPPD